MKTIEQIKEELAEEYGYGNWYGAVNTCTVEEMDSICNEIAQRAFNAALELAAEEATVSSWGQPIFSQSICVDKESILSLKINS